METSPEDVLSFGRPGYGAPVRTGSGRLRSEVRGNPEIRFQANEGVQNSICNQIRYASSKEEKAKYHSELGKITMGLVVSQQSKVCPRRPGEVEETDGDC